MITEEIQISLSVFFAAVYVLNIIQVLEAGKKIIKLIFKNWDRMKKKTDFLE